jgi:hypothetical protein
LILDLGEYSKEQNEFLDKFYKDNPWADNAPIDIIVKQTGLSESIIKGYIDQRRMKWYASNNYLNSNEFIPTQTIIKNDYDITTSKRKELITKKKVFFFNINSILETNEFFCSSSGKIDEKKNKMNEIFFV